jgi:hypothetical protein
MAKSSKPPRGREKAQSRTVTVKTRILISPDGTLTGCARGLPPGEHDAEVALIVNVSRPARTDAASLLARVREIQREIARLPVLDRRSPDEIIGYNDRGYFD